MDLTAQMNGFKQLASTVGAVGPEIKDELRIQALQSITESLETITTSPLYPSFLEHAVPIFLRILNDTEPQFLQEHHGQQLRKSLLDVLHRLPVNEHLRPYVRVIITLMFKLLEIDNEENVLICLRIIIELHKQFRPSFGPEIQQFLGSVKKIYTELPTNMPKIFVDRKMYKVNDLSEMQINQTFLAEVFSVTVIHSEKKNADGSSMQISVIPKATSSLKVLAELPIIVVLMYQLFKIQVHSEVAEFIPHIMLSLTLCPTSEQMASPGFNQEVFVDFMAAQIKTLSFLAYIVRLYQDAVSTQAGMLTTGMLQLFRYCPHEVAHLRKELLIAARHIFSTELKNQFIPVIDELFNEDVLIGTGWTAKESLRPLAYSTVADLVHHIRLQLPLKDLASAVSVFSRNVHDESLPTSIQTMCCKLLMNLVEALKNKVDEGPQARELLMRMLETFVLKFQTVAELQIPALLAKTQGIPVSNANHVGQQNTQQVQSQPQATPTPSNARPTTPAPATPIPGQQPETPTHTSTPGGNNNQATPGGTQHSHQPQSFPTESGNKDDKQKFGFPAPPSASYSLLECRSLVKTLVGGIKTVVNNIPSTKAPGADALQSSFPNLKVFLPKETVVFIRLVKFAMKALDVYMINSVPGGMPGMGPHGVVAGGLAMSRMPQAQSVRSKEEKEVLEHFAGVFQTLHPQVFREIFSTMIDYVVERIHENYALQIVANSFLANSSTSPIFATILVEYLLERMEDIGTNSRTNLEKSNLYLKLFKLVFGSVSLFAVDNEQMLKPHLHAIVNRSMELALSAKEPYNYFLLLRALFRSIGGGSHDLLYQEFLPLLPSLLQGLNSLQSGLHKQHMKDLFVELCLTVPVRLSSLLPYLPMLMDPLVSALNGSPTLVSQGLRTLELCVDNLQPDFLYDHIQPVRAELMQALWRTLRKPSDPVAQGSFRVLGKFGGGNRKMMTEPQRLRFREVREGFIPGGSSIVVNFLDHKQGIQLSIDKAVEVAVNSLKYSTTDPFYRRQCWEVIKGYLVAHISHAQEDEDRHQLKRFFNHPSFTSNDILPINGPFYKCADTEVRRIHEMALTGMFVAAAIKELRSHVLSFMVHLVRHYTLVAISQQTGPINLGGRQLKLHSMDPLVLIDAVVAVMGHEEKELCKPGHVALIVIMDTASTVLGTKDRACQLPLTEYLVEKMCSLCYERAWFAKLGGCIAIKFLFERMTLKWVFVHQYVFVKALFFVMMDLTGEVSSGAVDNAKISLEKLLLMCAVPVQPLMDGSNAELVETQNKSLTEVTQELVRLLTCANQTVRQQAIHSLEVIAKCQEKTITEIIEPHREVLSDMIPPKKHVLRHQPVSAQIGIMDGNTFCFALEPRIFTIDMEVQEHEQFFEELFKLCDSEDAVLQKFPCYKNVNNLIPLRKSALKCIASCHHILSRKDKIFSVLFKALSSSNSEIQQTGFECMTTFVSHVTVEQDVVTQSVSPLFRCIVSDHRTLNQNIVLRLTYLAELFPFIFTDQISDKMLQHLKKWLEETIVKSRGGRKCADEMKLCSSILNLFTKISTASLRFVESFLGLVFKAEKALMMEPGSSLRSPLRKFLTRYPEHTLGLLLIERNINEDQIYRFAKFLLKGDDGLIFRQILMKDPSKLIRFLSGPITVHEKLNPQQHAQQIQQQQVQQQQVQQQQAQQQQVQQQVQQPGQQPQQVTDPSQQPQQGQSVSQPQMQQPQVALPQPTKTVTVNYDLQYQAVLMTSILIKYDETWLSTQPNLVEALKKLWYGETFHSKHADVERVDYVQWEEPKLLVKCLLNQFKQNTDDIELLFRLLKAFTLRVICDFEFFRVFLDQTVSRYPVEWKRNAFMKFVEAFNDDSYSVTLKAKILQLIIIPSFAISFEVGEGEALIGGPPAPDQDVPHNLISVFINKVIDPDKNVHDSVRILMLQFSCLLVDQASSHIHDAANKRQGNKLRRLMTWAWPCLLPINCVDPSTKYHGHLLLAHIIAKFAIHKRIVLQVFHSLLKAFAVEARTVVRQALEVLTPAMPQRTDDGNSMLIHWTKKIIVEEGGTLGQLVHILQLLVRHFRVYYPVRNHLIQHMVTSIQRLGYTPNASIDHKKIAVDLAEVIIRWEVQRHREAEQNVVIDSSISMDVDSAGVSQIKIEAGTSAVAAKPTEFSNKPVEKLQADTIVNFLLRLACHVNEGGSNIGSPGDMLSRRCVNLLKVALKDNVWPNADLKLAWFDKLLLTVDTPQPNYGNICTALELLCFLLTVLRKDQVLISFKPLQKGIAACMTCNNTKVIRCVHNLLQRLMAQFPAEPQQSSTFSPVEELEFLYSSLNRTINNGLEMFEKSATVSPANLFSTLMILKAACVSNNQYIDRVITPFMRVLQRMAREHLSPAPNDQSAPMATELLIISLDLVKNRIGILATEMRKMFFQQILIILIEKSPDVKVLKAITKMTEDWVKQKPQFGSTLSPTLKEKAMLLIRMMQFFEKRFPNEPDLLAQYLELINYIYRDDSLKNSDITAKLEVAFMQGLRCPQPHIRAKFFEVFDSSIKKRLIDRLMYIVCSQNWEHIGQHFWIKQCIELILVTTLPTQPLESAIGSSMLPSPTAVILLGDQHERNALLNNESESDVASVSSYDPSRADEEDIDLEISSNEEGVCVRQNSTSLDLANIWPGISSRRPSTPSDPKQALQGLIKKENAFLHSLREVQTSRFLGALSQLCHMETLDMMSAAGNESAPDSSLAYYIWTQLFPKAWSILSERQQQILSAEITPFITSGAHVCQKEQPTSAIGCFVEGLYKCNPAIYVRPCVMKYLGKGHNLWHRGALMLENTVFEKTKILDVPSIRSPGVPKTSIDEDLMSSIPPPPPAPSKKAQKLLDEDGPDPPQTPVGQEALDCLSELYELLKEEDLWGGLWSKRAKHIETVAAIQLEQQGFFEQAQANYELAFDKIKSDFSSCVSPVAHKSEYMLWEKHWIRCSKELNQWETLMEYGQTKGCLNPLLVLESSWRLPNWQVMKDYLFQVEHNCPKEIMPKVALYKGFAYISDPTEHHLSNVDRMAEAASTFCIKEWRRLPPIVSHVHLQILQAAQQIMELSEAGQIQAGFLPSASGRGSAPLHDMKAIVKTWRNRLPVLADDMSHWSDIFSWRHHHYQAIVTHFETQSGSVSTPSVLPSVASSSVSLTVPPGNIPVSAPTNPGDASSALSASMMLGVHASAQSIIYFGKIARKHGLNNVCLDSLNRIHSIPSVPIVDCFQKIKQQVKCYLQMAAANSSASASTSTASGRNELQEGLEVIDSTNLKYFTKEMSAEFYAMKGMILAQSGRSDEANKAFSAAAQLHDGLNKAWSLWGDYLEGLFTKDRFDQRQMQLGVSAITCYLQACRHHNEPKSRKYLAKVLWLLTYDDEELSLEKAVKNYNAGIAPLNWLPWIPQLLTWLARSEGKLIMEILTQVGRVFPQAVYFPIRTLYLTLKLEHRERFRGDPSAAALAAAQLQMQQLQLQQQSSQPASVGDVMQGSSQGSSQPSTPQPGQSHGSQPPANLQVPPAMWRCSKIMHTQRDIHPTILHSLEGIVDQMVWFKENWYEEVLRQLKQALAKCYAVAFENRNNVQEATVSPNTLNFVKKVVSTFGVGIENVSSVSNASNTTAASESLARRAAATANDPVFQKMKLQFTADFDFSTQNAMKLHNLISKLKKWIKILEAKSKVLPKSMLVEEKCRFLSTFCQTTADVELPGEFLIPRHNHYYVRIARFMPRIEIVHKHNTAARRILIRGHNGKIYPYLLVNDSCLSDARREERVLQLLRLMNHYLGKQKETSKRFLSFTVPRVVAISPQTRLVEDNPSSMSLLDVYKERCSKKTIDPDSPIAKYYDKLAAVQARGSQASHHVLTEILKDIQKDLVPSTLLKEWAQQTFPNATDYWTFRKQFTLQMALISMTEYVLHLTRLNPDMLYIHQDSGLLNVSYFRFDVDDLTGDLEANRPVHFRLTHNLTDLMTPIGVSGPLTASMIASARCFIQPNFKLPSILRIILRDEVMSWHKKIVTENPSLIQASQGASSASNQIPGEKIVQMVNKSVNSIMARLQTMASFDGAESKAATLITAANHVDNLCRMDPAWHPWL